MKPITIPEIEIEILGYCQYGIYCICYLDEKGNFRDDEYGYDVTHWMPLPEHPV